jgi:hypothetical protein
MLKIITTIVLISSTATAACQKPVTYLTEGSNAPCSGYLFTPEAEKANYQKLEDLKILKETDKLQEQRFKETQTSLNEYIKYSRDLEKVNRRQQVTNDLTKVLYFITGIGVSYLMFKVANNEH